MTDTQKLDALDKLIEAVEAGKNPRASCYDLPYQICEMAGPAFRGSFDAALALHNALLPEWGWRVQQSAHGRAIAAVAKYPVAAVDVFADLPARAWLLAILKAYRAQVAQ